MSISAMVGWQRPVLLAVVVAGCNQAPADEYAFTYGVTVSTSATGDPGTDGGPGSTSGQTGDDTAGGSSGGAPTTGDDGATTGMVSGSTGGDTSGSTGGGLTAGSTSGGGSTSGAGTSGTTGAGTSTTGGAMGFACQNDNPRPVLSCGQQHMDNFIGNYGDVEDICGESMLYQDQLFELTPAQDTQVTVTFSANPDPGNGAIFVMEGVCNAGACVDKSTSAGDYHQVSFAAMAGTTYYIDLELPSQQPSYTLSVACN